MIIDNSLSFYLLSLDIEDISGKQPPRCKAFRQSKKADGIKDVVNFVSSLHHDASEMVTAINCLHLIISSYWGLLSCSLVLARPLPSSASRETNPF